MNKPLVTVLVCVYNAEKYVHQALQSVLDQTYKHFECIIIDDASTDSTTSILVGFSDKRFRIIKNETNIGLTKSLNIGLSHAQGVYVARLDADDVALPDRLETQVNFLEKNTKVVLVGSWVECINESGQKLKTVRNETTNAGIRFELNFQNCFVHSSIMFRKKEIMSLGGYNETFRYAQDFELYSKIPTTFELANIPKVLVQLRLHDSSVVVKHQSTLHKNALSIIRQNIGRYMPISENELEHVKQPLILKRVGKTISISDVFFMVRIIKAVCRGIKKEYPNENNFLSALCTAKIKNVIVLYIKKFYVFAQY